MAFDFVGDLVEPIAGHLVGRFKSRPRTAVHLSMFLVSLLVGLVFFCWLWGVRVAISSSKSNEDMGGSLGLSFASYISRDLSVCICNSNN